jgi:hypothetical protein
MSARSQEQVGSRDETYVKVASKWAYLYRAVDQHGQVIDVLLCTRRDLPAAGHCCGGSRGPGRRAPCHGARCPGCSLSVWSKRQQ